jgi:hypothetical protein
VPPIGFPRSEQREDLMAEKRSDSSGLDVLRHDFGVFLQAGFWVALLLNLGLAGGVAVIIYVGLERLP